LKPDSTLNIAFNSERIHVFDKQTETVISN